MTIPDYRTRYWFALNSWIDELLTGDWSSNFPNDLTELSQRSEKIIIDDVRKNGSKSLGEFQGYYKFLKRNGML